MPVVPFNNAQAATPKLPQLPPEPWALMAAAQMHSEGRLIEPQKDNDERISSPARNH